jgi:hypothetical protein
MNDGLLREYRFEVIDRQERITEYLIMANNFEQARLDLSKLIMPDTVIKLIDRQANPDRYL